MTPSEIENLMKNFNIFIVIEVLFSYGLIKNNQ